MINDKIITEPETRYASCIGCGWCCVKAQCSTSLRLHNVLPECPELYWNGERHLCKLAMLPEPIVRDYRQELHIGAGCCANMNSWRREPLKDRRKISKNEQMYYSSIHPDLQILLSVLGKEMISKDVLYLAINAWGNRLQEKYGKDKAKLMVNDAWKYITQNRSSMTEGFMG